MRAEADSEAALEWRLRFDAYTPALLHAQRHAGAGLTLVSQLRGARPADCAFQAEVVATVTGQEGAAWPERR